MSIDLHCHSQYSDGSTTLKDIVKIAEASGVEVLSITDHDTFEGSIKAEPYTGKYSVELIKGIEISSIDGKTGRRVHVLGYLCDEIASITQMCNETLLSRYNAGRIMIERIKKDYRITYKMVERYSNNSTCIYKQHIMNALMDAGYSVSVYGELYKHLFDREDGLAYEPVKYPEVREAVRLVNEAGGLAIIAHCSQFDSFDLIKELTGDNLIDGVEVWHPSNTHKDKERLIEYANEKGLLMTGGTDFHGAYSYEAKTLATQTTPLEEMNRMRLRKSQKHTV